MKLLAFAILFSVFSGKAQNSNSKTPQRILLSLTATPTESMAVTWRSNEKLDVPMVQFAITSDWKDFEDSAASIEAKTEKVQTGKAEVFHYSAEMKGLIPSQQYVYRVGGDSVWSEWNHFTTAKTGSEPYQFIWFGDIQHDVKKFGSRILREAYQNSRDAEFLLFTGDVVDRAEFDYQWEEFFYAAGFIPSVVPTVFTAGNHEYADTTLNGEETEVLVPLWQAHIKQPETDIEGIEETVFYFDYQGVRFIVLNGNEKLEEQAHWLDKILAENQNKWTIACVHQPIYSMSKGRDQQNTRNAFLPLFDKYSVDLVLQGHDHVYARTGKMKDGKLVGTNKKGTVYVTSNSGSDEYTPTSVNTKFAVKIGNKTQLFQVVSIQKNRIAVQAFTVTGALYDSFEIVKK
jgi:3',5'-cyclic AMP phosphodiesterase CpdA